MSRTFSLDSILDAALGSQSEREQPWRRFGLLQNPFPSRAHPIWDVLFNQEEVRQRFLSELGEFLQQHHTVTLFFTGGNRVGKTHFMEHHRRVLPTKLQPRGVAMPIVLVSAQPCDFVRLYQQMVDQVDESLRVQTGAGVFQDPLPRAIADRLQGLPPGDFRRAVEAFAQAGQRHELISVLLRQWLRGERLRSTQRRELGVSDNLDGVAQVLNAVEAFIKYLRLWDGSAEAGLFRCPGILCFMDELELIWQYRRDRRDQFLQTLRAFVDSCAQGGLFLCAGMATGGGGPTLAELERTYPALFQRLKGARSVPTLVQVGGVVEALGYAKAFLDHGRELARRRDVKEPRVPLLTDTEIEELFRQVVFMGSVSQGDFFDQLHNAAERKAAGLPFIAPGARF